MAIHAHSTTAPVVQAPLLPRRDARGRFVKPLDPRSADELLAEIANEIDRQEAVTVVLPSPARLPALNTAFSRRRAIFGSVAVDAGLSPAQEASQTSRRKELYEILQPETVNGSNQHSRVRQFGEANDRFTTDTAERTGRSERAVQRDAARGEALGADLGPTLHLRRQLTEAVEHGAAPRV